MAAALTQRAVAQTPAGTTIPNTADMRYELGGNTFTVQSNIVTILVGERLDVRLAREGQGAVVLGTAVVAIPLILTNANNGSESFVVSGMPSSGQIVLRGLALDADDDGRYDPIRDPSLSDDTTPLLASGKTARVFAIVARADGAVPADASLTISARATTGSGRVGSTYVGTGDGGSDAVVGPTGAMATVAIPLVATMSGPALIKSQTVQATDGSATAIRASVITYTLEARFPDAATHARVADPIPDGTVFVPGSLKLDGVMLTDPMDGDAGGFDGRAIAVSLGDVAAASTHIIQFKTRIQ